MDENRISRLLVWDSDGELQVGFLGGGMSSDSGG